MSCNFTERIKIDSSSENVQNVKRLNIIKLERNTLVGFLITVGSKSRSITRIGCKQLLILLIMYLALLKPKTGNVLQ